MLCLLSICILHRAHQEASDALSTDPSETAETDVLMKMELKPFNKKY